MDYNAKTKTALAAFIITLIASQNNKTARCFSLSFPFIGIENDTRHQRRIPSTIIGIENDTQLIGSARNLRSLRNLMNLTSLTMRLSIISLNSLDSLISLKQNNFAFCILHFEFSLSLPQL